MTMRVMYGYLDGIYPERDFEGEEEYRWVRNYRDYLFIRKWRLYGKRYKQKLPSKIADFIMNEVGVTYTRHIKYD